jgi:tripartite motif-containing protein 71
VVSNLNQSNGGPDGDIAFDAAGNFYGADPGHSRVQKFDAERRLLTTVGGVGSDPGEFINPAGLTIDAESDVIVSDFIAKTVQKFDAAEQFIAAFPIASTACLGVASNGDLWLALDDANTVVISEPDGADLQSLGEFGSAAGQFAKPVDVTFDAAGHAFVADLDNRRIQAFDPTGRFLVAWDVGATPTGAPSLPYAVAIDNRNLYVIGVASDYASGGNVQKFRLPHLCTGFFNTVDGM